MNPLNKPSHNPNGMYCDDYRYTKHYTHKQTGRHTIPCNTKLTACLSAWFRRLQSAEWIWGRERRLPIMDFTKPNMKNRHTHTRITLTYFTQSVIDTKILCKSLMPVHCGESRTIGWALLLNPCWKRVRSAGGLIRKIFVPEAQRRQGTKGERIRVTVFRNACVFVICMCHWNELLCVSLLLWPSCLCMSDVCVCTEMCCVCIFSM